MCKDRVFPQSQRPIQSPVARPFLGSGSRYDMRAPAGMRAIPCNIKRGIQKPLVVPSLLWVRVVYQQSETLAYELPVYPKEKLVTQLKSRLDEGPKWLKGSKVTAIGGPNSMLFETNSSSLSCFSLLLHIFLHPIQTFIVIQGSSFWSDELETLEVLHSFRSVGKETLQLHRNPHSAEQPHWPV